MSWKREEIPDHKFDFVDVDDFTDPSLARRLAYSTVFFATLKEILVYMVEMASITILLVSNKNSLSDAFQGKNATFQLANSINQSDTNAISSNPVIAAIGVTQMFMIILASLLLSFVLLAFEWKKAITIIKSRDISYAFTCVIAYRYYTIRSYPHYCFFTQIQNSRKTIDVLAFWVFFKFRGTGWKRLVFAELPRQFLTAILLYEIWNKAFNDQKHNPINTIQNIYAGTTSTETKVFFTIQLINVLIWLGSAASLLVAFLVYIPLLCNIRGNLKEYCVHKIDKRIDEILKRKSRKRVQEARRQEREKINVKGSDATLGSQPTLPSIDVDLESVSPRQVAVYPQKGPPSEYAYSDYGSDYGMRSEYSGATGYRNYGNYPPVPNHQYHQQQYSRGYHPQGYSQSNYSSGNTHRNYSPPRDAYTPVRRNSETSDGTPIPGSRYNPNKHVH
ncbi:hypothetical protein HDV04_002264 [Boothiomyces sp. JEL0838]|nr:hypothetical protein HDV04_002264 [Boothiomyces sp. JEL0838]